MSQNEILKNLDGKISKAVAHYWKTRSSQRRKQEQTGKADQGLRSAVTGGAQMDGFIDLFSELIIQAGIPEQYPFQKKGRFTAWLFQTYQGMGSPGCSANKTLIAAIEAKSQVGPSFGNNFNNRTEEAMGSALDLWTAFREQAYLESPQLFLGYFFMLEDCEASNRPVRVQEPHFKVFPEFVGASYMRRYELFCRKLVLERHYTASAFITSSSQEGIKGVFKTPADDLSMDRFAKILTAHAESFV